MTPEKEAELFVKLDMLIDMARRQDDRQARLEAAVNDLGQRVSRVEGRIDESPASLSFRLPTAWAGASRRPSSLRTRP